MVDVTNFEDVKDVHDYFQKILEEKQQKPCKANDVRTFVVEYSKRTDEKIVAMYVMFNAYCEINPSITIDKHYFESIIKRAWYTFLDDKTDTLYVDMGKFIMFNKRLRKRRF